MDVGEAIGIDVSMAMEEDLACPMEHTEPAKITSQPKIKEKSAARLGSNMGSGKGCRLFGIDDNGKVVDKGLQVIASEDPNPKDDYCTKAGKSNPVEVDGGDYPLSMAAHHIIPGKASLPLSKLKDYIWKSEGVIFGDIGYHVDGAENGIWLPTHQALSAGLGKKKSISLPNSTGKTYGEMSDETPSLAQASFVMAYTQKAMKLTNSQFHDAHEDYNEKMIEKLDAIHAWVLKASGDHCEECKKSKSPDGKLPPPHMLVFRLNGLALGIRGMLIGPPNNWNSFFTSDYSRLYKESEEQYMAYMKSKGGG